MQTLLLTAMPDGIVISGIARIRAFVRCRIYLATETEEPEKA